MHPKFKSWLEQSNQLFYPQYFTNLINYVLMYGNQTTDKVENAVSPLKFGLNTGKLTKFEFNPNGGKDNSAGECLDIEITIMDSDGNPMKNPIKHRLYPVTKAYDGTTEITDVNHPKFVEEVANLEKTINHFVYAYSTPEAKQQLFAAGGVASFAEFIAKLKTLMVGHENILVDVFLEYEYSLREDATQTYLRLPRNTKHGEFIIKHVNGDFEQKKKPDYEEADQVALKYVDKLNSANVHPFTRSGWYLNSGFAKLQKKDDVNSAGSGSSMPDIGADDTSW